MDPARLAELEAAWPIEVPVPGYSNGPIGPAVVIHELIAEIRRLNKQLDRTRGYWPVRITPLELERWTKRG